MVKRNITIVFKNNPQDDDDFGSGTYSVEYGLAKIEFKGEYILLETNNGKMTKVEVFPLKTIKAFKYN
tara:strand:+ start:228 stop:431 length:204 start_codon:yes stop_codon:yes gene_type:complete